MQGFVVGERFKPHQNLKKVYYIYLLIVIIPLLLISVLLICFVHVSLPEAWSQIWPFTTIPLIAVATILVFILYWIPKYYDSLFFTLGADEVVVERGIWWRMKHTVPYSRIMSVDTIQGPLSRKFGLGSVYVYAAGYAGAVGGTAGPGTRGTEAVIWGITNFSEVRDAIIDKIRGRPLIERNEAKDALLEILTELKKIRKALSKASR
ncbi:MAG: PH domain-containing protein [Sulfolobales archaeon]